MSAVIFSGSDVKTLKSNIDLNGNSKVLSGAVDPTSSATSAPVGSLYLNTSNGLVYRKLDAGSTTNWQVLGSGSSSGKNYINNPDAEANTTGWATYADAAGSRPVDGTGGSPNVTWTRSTSSPLRGIGSFIFTKDAANRQGQGVSYDLTIDSADQAKMLYISFDYAIGSGTYSGGTDSTDSDLIVYFYRTTATGRTIEPTPFKLSGAVIGQKYKFQGWVQTDSDATGYRLILHCATTSASAYTVQIDNVVVGPQVVNFGAPVTDWVAYTPTISPISGYATSPTGYTRRVGDSLEGYVFWRKDGSAGVGGGDLTISLPAGISIDSNKAAASVDYTALGDAYYTAANFSEARCVSYGSATLLHIQNPGGSQMIGTDIAASSYMEIRFRVPVQGWGSSVVMSNDADTRVVSLAVASNNNPSVTAGNPFEFDVTDKDSHGSWNASTYQYTVPVAGDYVVSANVQTNAVSYSAIVYVNGSAVKQLFYSSSSILLSQGSALITNLKAGDLIDLRPDATVTQANNSATTHMEIFRLSGPSAIAPTEVVAMRARKNSGSQTTSASFQTVTSWDEVSFDTHSAFNETTGVFTAPIAGFYDVRCTLSYDPNATGNRGLQIVHEGSASIVGAAVPGIASDSTGATASGLVKCVAGDEITIQAFQNSGGSLAYVTSLEYNTLSINRVG